MENGNLPQKGGTDPSSFLSDIIGNPVTVKLNSGVVYKGEDTTTSPRFPALTTHPPLADSDIRRRAAVRGWIHEHCAGEDGGVRQRGQEEVLWRHVCAWEQW